MALAQVSTNPLAIGEQYGFEESKLRLIKDLVAKDASNTELALFLYTCQRTGLDPLAKQIYCIKRKGKMTIQTGIDGYRLIADRTGNYVPGRAHTFEYDEQGNVYSATAYVMKFSHGTWLEVGATAYWDEYVVKYEGKPAEMWATKPRVMLGKCAEALALRRAFPAELSGLYTDTEMGDHAPIDAQYTVEPEQPRVMTPAPRLVQPEVTRMERAEQKFWATFEQPLGGRQWSRIIELLGGPTDEPESVDEWGDLFRAVGAALDAESEAAA